ncbi:hypothetical protein SUGI_0833190 [Cryptomeria japonica]|nr:hypothetical protein SUGI_0833190 [Cryptomeria japonica]
MQTAAPSHLFIVDDDEAKAEADGLVGTRFRPLQQHSENPSPTKCKRPSKETDEEGWVDMKKSPKVAASTSASASSISNTFLRDLHMDRVSRTTAGVEEVQGCQEIGNSSSTNGSNSEKQNAVVLLTYNVWFREDLEVHARMNELGNLIEQHQPHIICFQEVTPIIYEIFRHSNWWTKYQCSISLQSAKMRAYFCIQLSRLPVINFQRSPFRNSIMGRELCRADVDTSGSKQLVIATSHLESPCPAPPKWDQMYSAERIFQAKESFNVLKNLPNVIFAGDMNWDDRLDGEPPLPDGWYDVWVKFRPGKDGWTYDTKSNKMLTGNRVLRKRLDRIFCHLQDFEVESIDMVGTEPIPGLFHTKEKKTRKQSQILTLPVLPSDHYVSILGTSMTVMDRNAYFLKMQAGKKNGFEELSHVHGETCYMLMKLMVLKQHVVMNYNDFLLVILL